MKSIIEMVFLWVTGLYYGVLVLFDILKQVFKNGIGNVFSWKPPTKPSCLDDPSLGTHGYLHLEDVRIHYVASGSEDKPLMLLLHGFPEFWFSWRYQIKEFQKDYRVVAIDMRGYGDSDKPHGKDAYTIKKLTSDVNQVILALGYKSCILVGHDWGGAVAWAFGSLFPDMVDKLIIMNCPHFQLFQDVIFKNSIQRKMSWYMFFFLLPYLPELHFKINNYGVFDHVFDKRGARFSFSEAFQNPMSKEELDAYKYSFSQKGALTGSINYYRYARSGSRMSFDTNYSMPVLVVWGLKDLCLCSANPDAIEKANPKITIKRVPEAGHFVQMDTPDQVNKIVREWLESQDKS